LEDPLELCYVMGIVLPHGPVARQVHPRIQQMLIYLKPQTYRCSKIFILASIFGKKLGTKAIWLLHICQRVVICRQSINHLVSISKYHSLFPKEFRMHLHSSLTAAVLSVSHLSFLIHGVVYYLTCYSFNYQ
jgi:hypothetical protein